MSGRDASESLCWAAFVYSGRFPLTIPARLHKLQNQPAILLDISSRQAGARSTSEQKASI